MSYEDCNDILKIHGVRLEGENLQEVYTVRLSSNDTINRSTEFTTDTLWVPTIGDRYEGELQGSSETFRFHLFAQDSIVETYDFVYRDGECDVEKLSGPSEITF
ncbi:MAG: hypothetical protein WBG42_00670 [Cryomorphaceae bacterium]